jgi:hypothetical protein
MTLLIAPHVVLGELAVLAFLWVIVEVIRGPSGAGILRAKGASVVGVLAIFGEWVLAGTYYTVYYGKNVKPAILGGPWPWAHGIFTEAKEHIYLFLPFLSVVLLALVWQYGGLMKENRSARFTVYGVAGISILLLALSAMMGYMISNGYREALVH